MAPQFKARTARAYGGRYRITRYANNVGLKRSADTVETTVIEQNDKTWLPTLQFGDMNFAGMLDGATGVPTTAWQKGFTNDLGSTVQQPWTVGFFLDSVGAMASMFQANQAMVGFNSPVAGMVAIAGGVQPSSAINLGRFQLAGTSTVSATGAQASVDYGTAGGTPNGGFVHYHLTDVTTGAGSTVATFKVVLQHSSLAAVWADVAGTSSTFSGAGQARTGSVRKPVSGTVKRFTRVNVSAFTGGVSRKVNIAAAFARSSQ